MVCEVEEVEVDWCLQLAVSDICWSHGRGFESLVSLSLFLQMPLVSPSLQRGCVVVYPLLSCLALLEPWWCSCHVGEWSVVCG